MKIIYKRLGACISMKTEECGIYVALERWLLLTNIDCKWQKWCGLSALVKCDPFSIYEYHSMHIQIWGWHWTSMNFQIITLSIFVTVCEGPGGHPTLFWEVATGLGGVVGKKGAGDGGLYTQLYSHLFTWGNSFVSTPKQVYRINKQIFTNTKDGRTQSATDIREN